MLDEKKKSEKSHNLISSGPKPTAAASVDFMKFSLTQSGSIHWITD